MTQPIQQPQIPQLTPEEANREATPAEIRQLQAAIHKVRKVIARFHETRRRNNERMAGLRAAKLWPQQVQQIVHATRQPEVEAQAVEQLRQFLRVLRGHEPTRQEMQEGIPEGLEQQMGMGGLPFAVAAVAMSLATGVHSVFSYLEGHEDRIALQSATPLERGLKALSDNIWGVAAIGAVAGGVYVYHKSTTADDPRYRRRRKLGRSDEEALEEGAPEEGAPEEQPSLLSKASSFVRNGLFGEPPTGVDKLSEQYEKLDDEEKNRFIDIINGETDDEEPEEAEEPEEIEENEEEEEECTGCPGDSEEEPEEPEDETEVEENPEENEEEPLEENEEPEEDEEEQDEPEGK